MTMAIDTNTAGVMVVDIPQPDLIDEHIEIQVDGQWYTFLPFQPIPEHAGRYKWRRVRTYAEEFRVE